MTKPLVRSLFVLASLYAATADAQVRHAPPTEATLDHALDIVVQPTATTNKLVLHVRTAGTAAFTELEMMKRPDGDWIAEIPAKMVTGPDVEYYVTDGTEVVFATPEWPHAIAVRVPEDEERRTRDRIRSSDRRTRLHAMGEWIEFGSTPNMSDPTKTVPDHFYRFEADFGYRLWAYPLEEIRVGYMRLIGDTTPNPNCDMPPCTSTNAGFKVGGWFELGLAPIEGIHIDGRVAVMATQDGFGAGTRVEGRLGDRDGSHIALGAEYLQAVGANGFFRLGWGTVPGLPMAATVEVTNMPETHRPSGVRLYYDIAREVAAGARIGFRIGYASRNQNINGFTGGAGVTVEF